MSILSPLSSRLDHERLAMLLASDVVTDAALHLLRWLIWFPLLSVEELTRLERTRLAKQERTRSPQRVAAQLQELEALHLITHLVINEPGWPPHQHRYMLTDPGLYVFAARLNPPLSVSCLARAYAVERADIIARLARVDVHLVLADFATRLINEGCIHGYSLVSYQQPWQQADTVFGQRQTTRCDAAFVLGTPEGTEHALYVRVDPNERAHFDRKQERTLLLRLLNLRSWLHLQGELMPRLLILTRASHLVAWGELLARTCEQRGTALLDGAITTIDYMQRAGVYGAIWWKYADLVQSIRAGARLELEVCTQRLSQMLGPPTNLALTERFSQRRSFEHLRTEQTGRSLRKTVHPLPSYVGKPLTQEIAMVHSTALVDGLCGTKLEQQEATALLNLTLSAMQKDLLFWLAHHPLLTVHHLATLHYPETRNIRSTQIQLGKLTSHNLLIPFSWYRADTWQDRERYVLAESALRYSALREGRPATSYLLPEVYKEQYTMLAFSVQRGTAGLFAQMQHTHGLYTCMAHLMVGVLQAQGRIITWKNAREAIRWYHDPFTKVPMQIRPDAEVIYLANDQTIPYSILVEYDRATTTKREYEAKYQSYADYQEYTGIMLPPILVITQDEQAAARIRTSIDTVRTTLSVVIVLECQIQRQRLHTLFNALSGKW